MMKTNHSSLHLFATYILLMNLPATCLAAQQPSLSSNGIAQDIASVLNYNKKVKKNKISDQQTKELPNKMLAMLQSGRPINDKNAKDIQYELGLTREQKLSPAKDLPFLKCLLWFFTEGKVTKTSNLAMYQPLYQDGPLAIGSKSPTPASRSSTSTMHILTEHNGTVTNIDGKPDSSMPMLIMDIDVSKQTITPTAQSSTHPLTGRNGTTHHSDKRSRSATPKGTNTPKQPPAPNNTAFAFYPEFTIGLVCGILLGGLVIATYRKFNYKKMPKLKKVTKNK